MALSNRLQYLILCLGLLTASALLLRFAADFGEEMSLMLAVPFWALVLTALVIAALNLFPGRKEKGTGAPGIRKQAALLAAVPLGFLASTLDCMGLSVEGCTTYCTFIKLGWIPLIAIACAAYLVTRKAWLVTAIALMAFVTLAPHCVCYNPGNGWWIERFGSSPVCYSWGFVVSVISVGALRPGALYWPSVGVCYAIITGATGFFISHHYLHFPW